MIWPVMKPEPSSDSSQRSGPSRSCGLPNLPCGVCVVMVSSELPEILGISDRILVMRGGAIAAEVTRADATEEGLLKLALPLEAAAAKP